MKSVLAFLNSDGVNKYGYLFPIKLFADALKQHWSEGLPQCLGHDLHKPIGWVYPFGVYFKPGLALLTGDCWIAETKSDFENVKQAHAQMHYRRQAEMTEDYYEELKKELGSKLKDGHKAIFAGCAGVLQDRLAEEVFLNIFEKKDEDGLIPLNVLVDACDYLGQGVFSPKGSNLTLHAHPYLRKSLSLANSFHHLFIDELMQFFKESGTSTKIRLDSGFIGHRKSFKSSIELEYWYGPLFADSISKIDPGVTVHESNEYERAYNDVLRTEFFWYDRDNTHTLECEEVTNAPSPGLENKEYGCRYVHAIHDDISSTMIHFDGAIRAYSEEKMVRRQDNTIDKAGRETAYTKLFRLDGNFPVSAWKKLCVLFFQGNFQIKEYFGLREDKLESPKNGEEEEQKPQIPILVDDKSGPRILLSIQNKADCSTPSFINYDSLTLDGEKFPAIDADAIELVKEFRSAGFEIEFKTDTVRIDIDDVYLNAPTMFSQTNTDAAIRNISSVLEKFLDRLKRHFDTKFVSLSIAAPFENATIQIAFAGDIEASIAFFKSFPIIPIDWGGLPKYLEDISSWMKGFKNDNEIDDLEFIKRDGVLHFFRPPINHHFEIIEEDGKTIIRPTDKYVEFLFRNGLAMKKANVLFSTKCSACHQEYIGCSHIKEDDAEVNETVEEFRIGSIVATKHFREG